MKTSLVFFDNKINSYYGTLRGIVVFTLLIIALTPLIHRWSGIKMLSFLVFLLLLCSAISVQLPNSNKNAFVYGLLVGIVVFTTIILLLYNTNYYTNIFYLLLILIYTSLVCGLSSLIVYNTKLYPN